MLKALSDRPDVEKLERFLDRLLETPGPEIEFVILFGSMAKGNRSFGSDYDILVGLTGTDGKRLIDRMGEFDTIVEGNIEVFPYDRPAWERMFAGFNLLFLEAMADGVILFDRGSAARMRTQFEGWRTSGVLTRLPHGWKIADPV